MSDEIYKIGSVWRFNIDNGNDVTYHYHGKILNVTSEFLFVEDFRSGKINLNRKKIISAQLNGGGSQ